MQTKDTADAFRQELKKYGFYYRQVKHYSDRYIMVCHEERGIIGKDLGVERVQGTGDPSVKVMRRLELIEEKEQIEVIIRRLVAKMRAIEEAINEMDKDIGGAIKNIYITRKSTLIKESKRLNFSKRQLQRKIDEEILKLSTRSLQKVII